MTIDELAAHDAADRARIRNIVVRKLQVEIAARRVSGDRPTRNLEAHLAQLQASVG